MENSKKAYANIAIKWAAIYTATSIILVYLFQFMDVNQTTSPLRFLTYVPLIAFLLLTQKEYRDQLGGFLTFGEGFMAGFIYSVFVGIFSTVFVFIYFKFLSPQVWEQLLQTTRDQMAQKNMSSDQIDQAMNITTKYGIIFACVGALIATPIIGAIISLIGAAIFKKERSIADIEKDTPTTYPDSAV